jgi:hypothetical protein
MSAILSNVTHVVVLKPLQYGYFNFTSGVVSYKESEDAAESTVSHIQMYMY